MVFTHKTWGTRIICQIRESRASCSSLVVNVRVDLLIINWILLWTWWCATTITSLSNWYQLEFGACFVKLLPKLSIFLLGPWQHHEVYCLGSH